MQSNIHYPVRVLLLASAALLASAGSQEALAADAVRADESAAADSGEGEAIIVTARRREESAQDVPIALSVLSGDNLLRTGNANINQLQFQVPSLQVISLNPRNSNINIRGLGSNSSVALDGLEAGFGFYVDGVYYARPGQAQFDLTDIQRVEVLKGPQGTLFGKNTTAGAINITTRLPSFDPELTAEGSLGSYGYHQVRGSVSLPIVADKVAVRLTFADTHRDGFLHNRFDSRRAQDSDNFTVRGQLLIKPSEDLSIRLIGDYSNNQQHSISVPGGYFTTQANGATIANNVFVRAARNNYTLLSGNPFDRVFDLDDDFQHFMKSYGVSGEVNWNLGGATLTSVTAYRWWDWYPRNDVDGTSLKGQQAYLDNHQRQFSQEFRVASDGQNTIDYVAGLYYFWQVVRGVGQNRYGPGYAEFNLNPAAVPAATFAIQDRALTGFQADQFSNPQTKSYAAFGQIDWHIADDLTLTGGLRFTHEDKKGNFTQRWTGGLDITTLSPADQAIARAARAVSPELSFDARVKSDALSGLATLAYKVAPDVLVYATYSHGSKSGGLNVTAGGAFQPVIKPEKVDAFELGFKSQFWDRKVTLNGALFENKVNDYQASISEFIGNTTTTRSYIANIPKVRSRGFELDLTVAPSRWVNLTGAVAYTDAKYVRYPNAPQAPERLYLGAIQNLSGVSLPGIPKWAFSLGLDVAQPLNESDNAPEVYGRADFSYRTEQNASANNSIYGLIPAYGLLNARIGVRAADGLWDLSLWARNLTDKNYLISRSPNNFGLITALVGDPRTYGVTLRTKL